MTSPTKSSAEEPATERTTARKLLDILTFAHRKGREDVAAAEDPLQPNKAKATARQEPAADSQKKQDERRIEIRRLVEQTREERKRQEAEERRVQSHFAGGLARGYDPNAGMLRKARDDKNEEGPKETGRPLDTAAPADTLLTPKRQRGTTWGTERGRPGDALMGTLGTAVLGAVSAGVHHHYDSGCPSGYDGHSRSSHSGEASEIH